MKTSGVRQWLVLLGFLVAVGVIAVAGSIATISNVDGWYQTAQKPSWTPPNWVFGPVWTVLYIGMAVAAWLVWRSDGPRRTAALSLYWAQLVLNAVWTPLFFAGYPVWGVGALWGGAVVIVLMDLIVIACVALFWRINRFAAAVMIVYLAWLLYATTLNIGFAALLLVP